MGHVYSRNPGRIEEIACFVQMEPKMAAEQILLAKHCFFYDTCSFRKHMQMTDPMPIFHYFREEGATIIILRTILMELSSEGGNLKTQHIEYLRKMHDAGIHVMLLYEEDVYECVRYYCQDTRKLCDWLQLAVNVARSTTGTVEGVLQSDSALRKALYSKSVRSADKLYQDFFQKVASGKSPGDNLGEEMIHIWFHLLSHIPLQTEYKYILLTEDKGAISSLQKVIDNVKRHLGVRLGYALTSARLAQVFYEKGLLTSKEELNRFLLTGNPDGMVKIFAMDQYELKPEFKTMTCEELTERIMESGRIHICY